MLIQATFENVLSFNRPTTFSMVAGKITKQHKDHVKKVDGIPVLRGAILYGANAAGKSNLIKVLSCFSKMLADNDCGVFLGRNFQLVDKPKPDMVCELLVNWKNYLYRYRVKTDGAVIKEEILWSIKNDCEEILFAREKSDITFGTALQDDWYRWRTVQDKSLYLMKLFSDGLRENSAKIPNSDILLSAVWALQLIVPFSLTEHVGILPTLVPGDASYFKKFLKELLAGADAGISDVISVPIPPKTLESMPLAQMLASSKMDLLLLLTPAITYCFTFGNSYVVLSRTKTGFKGEEIKLRHGNVTFPLEAESEGTRRLVEYAPCLLFLRDAAAVYLVDEFDCHLHPVLAKALLKNVFANANANAQFIVTAHDTTLMSHDIWRTDEIWFAEKRQDGSTDLYSMYNFTPRFDKNLEKGYRQGLYGAVPFPNGGMRQ